MSYSLTKGRSLELHWYLPERLTYIEDVDRKYSLPKWRTADKTDLQIFLDFEAFRKDWYYKLFLLKNLPCQKLYFIHLIRYIMIEYLVFWKSGKVVPMLH